MAARTVSFRVEHIPPFLSALSGGGFRAEDHLGVRECAMVINTSAELLATPEKMLVGFAEGAGAPIQRLDQLPDRQCAMYRVVEVSECGREGAQLAAPKPRPLQSAALVSALGPVDLQGSDAPWAAWNDKVRHSLNPPPRGGRVRRSAEGGPEGVGVGRWFR
jgi:hypothetical protein